ncbi:MAG: YggT family protein [Treponema sp.]|nr:YggT family protein [Treponema sp.]MBR5965165.1 YggT family protein [Treponema sp.]
MIYLFRTLAGAVSIYSLLCVIRIVLTWIPGASYTGFGRFLSAVCDPFLNAFRFGWLRFGAIDFSPLFALALLSAATILFQTLGSGARLTLAGILALAVQIIWSIVASVFIFLIAVLAVRLIVFLTGADRSSPLWQQIDASLNPLVYSVTKFFSAGRPIAYKNALILALVLAVLLRFVIGPILVGCLVRICAMIPF